MIKSFVDEFTTEEVNVEGEEGQTILEVAQNNGCSINCILNQRSTLCHSILWWKLSLWWMSY